MDRPRPRGLRGGCGAEPGLHWMALAGVSRPSKCLSEGVEDLPPHRVQTVDEVARDRKCRCGQSRTIRTKNSFEMRDALTHSSGAPTGSGTPASIATQRSVE